MKKLTRKERRILKNARREKARLAGRRLTSEERIRALREVLLLPKWRTAILDSLAEATGCSIYFRGI